MKRSIRVASTAGIIALLSACGGENLTETIQIDDYRPTIESDGIDFYAQKLGNKNIDCYYRGPNKIPHKAGQKIKDEFLMAQLVFIGHDPDTGSFTRFEPKNSAIARGIQNAVIDEDNKTLVSIVSGLTPSDYQPADAATLESTAALNILPNPFDLSLSWYSKIAFILIEDTETFENRSPFRVAVGVAGAKSPFRSVDEVNDKIVVVDYTSLPPRKNIKGYDTISKRNCLYYYDLSLRQTFADKSGKTVQVPITIDPGGEGDNGPDNDDPPGSNGWP